MQLQSTSGMRCSYTAHLGEPSKHSAEGIKPAMKRHMILSIGKVQSSKSIDKGSRLVVIWGWEVGKEVRIETIAADHLHGAMTVF